MMETELPITRVVWSHSPAVQPADVVRDAVADHAAECRFACRQAKRVVWPAARAWHTFTGWPQTDVERAAPPAWLHRTVSAVFESPKSRLHPAVGAAIATPLHALVDLVGLAGAAALSLVALSLDVVGAAVGIAVGALWAPYVAYRAAG